MEEKEGLMKHEIYRRMSFKEWPLYFHITDKIHVHDLAQFGFYYTGPNDRVKCAFCSGTLCDWTVTSDGAYEAHKQAFPECPLIVNIDKCENIPYSPSRWPIPTWKKDAQAVSRVEKQSQNQAVLKKALHQKMVTLHARKMTYLYWPINLWQSPEECSEAGLFYTGFKDSLKCFFCDIRLFNWKDYHDPWVEHARWFPKCLYVLNVRGQKFVDSVQDVYAPHGKDQELADAIQYACAPAVMNIPAVRTIVEIGFSTKTVIKVVRKIFGDSFPCVRSLLKAVLEEEYPELGIDRSREAKHDYIISILDEHQKLKNERMCKICFENICNIVFIPCGHLCTCFSCASSLKLCPLCRAVIKSNVKIFIC